MSTRQERVFQRKNTWEKFGKAKLSSNNQVSWKSKDVIHLHLGTKEEREQILTIQKDKIALENLFIALMSAKYDFDDLVVVYDDIVSGKYERANALIFDKTKTEQNSSKSPKTSVEPSNYVPPHLRNGYKKEPESTSKNKLEAVTNKKFSGFAVRMLDVPDYVTENDIRRKCSLFGRVSRINFLYDKFSGAFRGIVFINFSREEEANRCVEEMNGMCWEGVVIKVEADKRK